MRRVFSYIKKNAVFLVLLLIVVGAFAVRTYKFDDWLYFKMDQSRDALMLTNAVENGPQYLPLLGARVGAVDLKHGMLRLGPISYYFQYLSAKIFHSTDAYVYAYPDLLASILAIPMLYLLARLYFSKKNSLLITAMYAFSYIIIQYSRFAWNPNSLQLYLLMSFYGLLRFLNEHDLRRKKWWLIIWAVAMTIGSQLHFFGFFSLLGISGLMILSHFEIWKKQNIAKCFKKNVLVSIAKYAVMGLLVFTIFYTPVIISDVYKKGENTHNFFEALGSKPANKPLQEKLFKGAGENLKYYCLITTSQCYGSSLKKEYPAVMVTSIVMLAGIVLIARKLRRKSLPQVRKDFLILLVIWLGVFTVLTVPVSFQLRPRFFIVVFAIPFIFLGLLFEYIDEKMRVSSAIALSVLLAAGIIGWNSHGTYAWFKEQAASQNKSVAVKRTLILKAKDGVTLGQLQGVTDWMYSRLKQDSNLYYYVKPEHVRPIEFLLYKKHDPNMVYKTMTINADGNAQYFAITSTKSDLDAVYSKYPDNDISVIAQHQFGQLLVSEIAVNDRSVSPTFRFNKSTKKTDRIFWKDVFKMKEDSQNMIRIDNIE